VPQVIVGSPVGEADLGDKSGLEPSAFLHHFGRQSFAPSGAFPFRKIGKRTPCYFERPHLRRDLSLQGRRKSVPDLGNEDQLPSFVVAHQEQVKAVSAGQLAADHQFLPLDGG